MTKTVKGRVQATSDKAANDYFGVCIDDEWYNGPGSLEKDLQGKVVELEIDSEEWTDIQKMTILEEDSEGAEQGAQPSDAGNGGDSNSGSKTSSTPNPKRANIQATAATKKAADIVAEHYDVEPGQFEEKVSTVANGLNNVMNNLYEANME